MSLLAIPNHARRNRLARRGTQSIPKGIPITCLNKESPQSTKHLVDKPFRVFNQVVFAPTVVVLSLSISAVSRCMSKSNEFSCIIIETLADHPCNLFCKFLVRDGGVQSRKVICSNVPGWSFTINFLDIVDDVYGIVNYPHSIETGLLKSRLAMGRMGLSMCLRHNVVLQEWEAAIYRCLEGFLCIFGIQ